MTKPNPFVRVVPGSYAATVHAAKARFPNESLCGRRLKEAKISGRHHTKCRHCVNILKKAREASGS